MLLQEEPCTVPTAINWYWYTYICTYIRNAWYHKTVHASHMNIITLLSVKAATGLIGGDLSHELHVVADIGEDTVVSCPE